MTAQRKQSPVRRKFAQSGHPVNLLLNVLGQMELLTSKLKKTILMLRSGIFDILAPSWGRFDKTVSAGIYGFVKHYLVRFKLVIMTLRGIKI
jgi:hypothetical protein